MAARILASRHRVALSTLCFMTLFFFAGPVSIEVCGLRAVDCGLAEGGERRKLGYSGK